MNPIVLRKATSGVSIAGGLLWLWTMCSPFVIELKDRSIIIGFILIAMSIPGIIALVGGFRLFRFASVNNLKLVMGGFAMYGALFIAVSLSSIFRAVPENFSGALCEIFAAVIIFPVFLYAVRQFSFWLRIGRPKLCSLIGKESRIVFACLILKFLIGLFDYVLTT